MFEVYNPKPDPRWEYGLYDSLDCPSTPLLPIKPPKGYVWQAHPIRDPITGRTLGDYCRQQKYDVRLQPDRMLGEVFEKR